MRLNIRQEAFSQNASQFNFVDPANGKNHRRRSIRKEGAIQQEASDLICGFHCLLPMIQGLSC